MRSPSDSQIIQISILAATPDRDHYFVEVSLPADGLETRGTMSIDAQRFDTHSASKVQAQLLGEALFADSKLRSNFHEMLTLARSRGSNVRIQFRIESPELFALPWELLSDPRYETPLVADPSIDIVRVADSRLWRRDSLRSPSGLLRLLIATAAPEGMPAPDSAGVQDLSEVFDRRLSVVRVKYIDHATPVGLYKELAGGYDLLHLTCPMVYVNQTTPALVLEDEQGRAHLMVGKDLMDLVAQLENKPTFVFLLATANESDKGAAATLAANLVEVGVQAVAGWNTSGGEDICASFLRHFYTHLLADGRADQAMSRARRATLLQDEVLPDAVQPVLWMGAETSRLFGAKAADVSDSISVGQAVTVSGGSVAGINIGGDISYMPEAAEAPVPRGGQDNWLALRSTIAQIETMVQPIEDELPPGDVKDLRYNLEQLDKLLQGKQPDSRRAQRYLRNVADGVYGAKSADDLVKLIDEAIDIANRLPA